jgi:PAS domain S-box-containing protein
MHGYDSPAQMMGAITDIARQYYVRAEDRERLKAILAEQGTAESFKAEVYRKDGSIMRISINASIERDQSGRISSYIGTVREI